MILERLRIAGWRGYREPFEVEFDSGLNLVVGPNEAGKSTLFEAVTRAMFDRHTSKAAEIRGIQPLGSTLAPEVELVFRVGDERYLLEKRFLREPRARLSTWRQGGFELDHEGDRADEAVRRVLGGEMAHGVSKPQHRGLAQALWYLQRDPGLPAKDWSVALREGLAGLVEATLRTPATDRFLALLEEEHARYFTRTGRPRQKGELASARLEVSRVESALRERSAELDRGGRYRDELGRLRSEREGVDRALADARRRLAALHEQLDRRASLEAERQSLLEAAERERHGLGSLRETWKRVEERSEHAAAIAVEIERVAGREGELRVAVRELRRTAEGHARRWEDQLSPRLKGVREQVEELKRHRRIGELELELGRLRARSERLAELRARVRTTREKLSASRAPEDRSHREVEGLAREAELLRARMDASAVRVRFSLEGGHEVRVDPEAEAVGGDYFVTEPTSFEIPSVGKIDVRRADDPWRRDAERYRLLEQELAERLRHAGVDSVEAYGALVRDRRRLESELRDLQSRLRELEVAGSAGRTGDDTDRHVGLLQAELERLRCDTPQAVLPGIENWVAEQTSGELHDLENELARLEKKIAVEREAEQGRAAEVLSRERRAATDRTEEIGARRREAFHRRAGGGGAVGVRDTDRARATRPDGGGAGRERRSRRGGVPGALRRTGRGSQGGGRQRSPRSSRGWRTAGATSSRP